MKKSKIITIILCITGAFGLGVMSTLISQPKKTEESTNLMEEFRDIPLDEISASYEININSFEYEDDTISAEITYDNGPVDCEIGMTVFVNGIAQPYHDDNTEKDSYIIPYDLPKNESKKIKIKFKPVTGKKDEKLSIVLGSMINPSYKTDTFYENNQKVFYLEPQIEKCKTDNNSIDSISYYENYNQSDPIDKNEASDTLSLFQENEQVNRVKITNNRLKCDLTLFGAEDAEYTLSAYINHKQVPLFNNLSYAKIKTTKGKVTTMPFDFDVSDFNILNNDSFYIVAIPNRDDLYACKLNTLILDTM